MINFSCSIFHHFEFLTSHTAAEMANGVVLKLFKPMLQFVTRNIFSVYAMRVQTFSPSPSMY